MCGLGHDAAIEGLVEAIDIGPQGVGPVHSAGGVHGADHFGKWRWVKEFGEDYFRKMTAN